MPFSKQRIFTLILLILIYAWYFIGHFPNINQNATNVLGAKTNVSLFIQPDMGKSPILNEINNAKHEILIEVYLLSDKDVISSLCMARERGLAVNVMLEEHPFGGGNLNDKSKKALLDCDISVNWTNPTFALTHEKAIILDNQEAFILNQNLTSSAFSKNREYDIFDTNKEDVDVLRKIFLDDWKRQTFSLSISNLIISPNNSRSIITSLMESSGNLDIEIEDIDDNQIVSILSQIAKKHIVRIIVPTLSQINSNKIAINKLSSEGILIKTLSSPYVHAKLIISTDKAYVGSINLSSQSLDKNREVGIVISSKDILETLTKTFEKDWASASNYYNN